MALSCLSQCGWRSRLNTGKFGQTVEMDAFAAMIQRVIADEGFDGHLPIACYPQSRVVRVLEDAPPAVDIETVALDWALAAAEAEEEVLLVFKVDSTQCKVIRRTARGSEHAVYPATSGMGASEHS